MKVTGTMIGHWPVAEVSIKTSASPAYIGSRLNRGAPRYGEDNDYRVNLDLWYPGPPMKGGHHQGNVTVRRSPEPPDRGARFDQSHRERVAAVGPPL